jgi:hypothetical protein
LGPDDFSPFPRKYKQFQKIFLKGGQFVNISTHVNYRTALQITANTVGDVQLYKKLALRKRSSLFCLTADMVMMMRFTLMLDFPTLFAIC